MSKWSKFQHIGEAILGAIAPQILVAEQGVVGIVKSGKTKKEKVVEAALVAGQAADAEFGTHVVNEPRVRALVEQINDLTVALHNAVAEAAAAAKAAKDDDMA